VFAKVKHLSLNLVVYGMGDVAVSIAGFCLLPLFTRILSESDYGVIYLLLTVELVAKVVFRWGVDASFMRLYYDCHDDRSRRRLASTIFLFLLAVNGAILALALGATPFIARRLFDEGGHGRLVALVLVNTFVGGFFFIPFHVLRMERKSLQFSALTFSRAVSTLVLRVLLVAVARLGVLGFILPDIIVTSVFAVVLARWFAGMVRPTFSMEVLRQALRFGLPRVPHGVAQQVMGPGTDAALLRALLPPVPDPKPKIGVYGMGMTFGLILKFFLSAFEYAWAPFYFETMKEADAKVTFSRITTYGVAALVFMTAGLSAIAFDLLRLVLRGFAQAAPVVPWIAIGVTFQGVYLLTSIGLNITKRTRYYPIATGITAAVNVGCNIVLIPRYGILGPAYSNVISYATLAAISMYFSQRCYPISYEWNRLARVVLAGVIAYGLATWPLPALMHSLVGVLVRATIVAVAFPGCLALTGFFRNRELARLRQLVRAITSARPRRKPAEAEEPEETPQ